MKKFRDGDLVIFARGTRFMQEALQGRFVIGNAYRIIKGDVGTSNVYVSDGETGWYVPEKCFDLVGNFDADDLKELRHDIEYLKSRLERLSKPREKTLSEASYEELAKEMWKRCAENTSLI